MKICVNNNSPASLYKIILNRKILLTLISQRLSNLVRRIIIIDTYHPLLLIDLLQNEQVLEMNQERKLMYYVESRQMLLHCSGSTSFQDVPSFLYLTYHILVKIHHSYIWDTVCYLRECYLLCDNCCRLHRDLRVSRLCYVRCIIKKNASILGATTTGETISLLMSSYGDGYLNLLVIKFYNQLLSYHYCIN